jgi:hypothetical protein
MGLIVVYSDPGGVGYHPVLHMARLAAELLAGELLVLPTSKPARAERITALLRRRARSGSDRGLVICASPGHLRSLLDIPGWRERFSTLVAWVFDSFWHRSIPRSIVLRRHFDRFFVTEPEDLDVWRRRTGVPVELLPWGSDVLRLGSGAGERDIDLLRFGRQPAGWDDDDATAEVCRQSGIAFHGRPAMHADASQNEAALMKLCGRTRFALAFSNLANPALQTHPTRQYITARWVDALASGASVAGVPPVTPVVDSLFWPGALLDLRGIDRREGLSLLSTALRAWTPAQARLNHRMALERLDWRWRFAALAAALGEVPRPLSDELDALRARIAAAQ